MVLFQVRKGDGQPLPAKLAPATDKDGDTVSVVTILPSKEDDGSEYQCEVSSRALPPMGVLTKAVNISVNCKFPLIELIKKLTTLICRLPRCNNWTRESLSG